MAVVVISSSFLPSGVSVLLIVYELGGVYVAGMASRKQPRAKWSVANRGEAESTSHDWVPGKPLFEATFGSEQPWHDAEVCAVMRLRAHGVCGGREGFFAPSPRIY